MRNMKTCISAVTIAFALVGFSAPQASAACPPTALSGPFCIDGDDNAAHHPTSGVGQTQASDIVSSQGGAKELSATNGNPYKLFNINYATPPGVLSLTSQPSKVDLTGVAT